MVSPSPFWSFNTCPRGFHTCPRSAADRACARVPRHAQRVSPCEPTGLPNKRIASQLTITEGTAKMHLHSIYRKLRVRGRMELMRQMQERGV